MKRLISLTYLILLLLMLPGLARALDMELAPYRKLSNLSGKLRSVGSDTLGNEMRLWAEAFQDYYPHVTIDIESKGSNTAPPALFDGSAQLAPMSRQMTDDEIEQFRKKYGYKPTAVLVAIDALAIYVNKENPLQCITIEQLDRVFGAEHKTTQNLSIHNWGELGLAGEWANKPIDIYGRNDLSGTYRFFKQKVLASGDYKTTIKIEQGSEALVKSIANNKIGIGYSSVGYKSNDVKIVAINTKGKCFDPSFENTYSRKYPLARGLFVYILKDPKTSMDPVAAEFVKYILSKDGQSFANHAGYYPITNKIRDFELTRLGLMDLSK